MYLTVFLVFLKIILCIYSFFDAFLSPSDEGRGPSCSADMLCIQNPESLSVKEQLNLAISDSLQPPPQQHSGTSNLATVIRQEIALFEGGGSRGRHLPFVYVPAHCATLVSKPRGCFRQRELFAPDYAHDWMMPHSITYAFFGLLSQRSYSVRMLKS